MPVRPSYRGGFAPETGQPRYPELWRGCRLAVAPCLGPSGVMVKDHSGFKNHMTLTNTTLSSAWTQLEGRYCLSFDGTDDHALTALGSGVLDFTGSITMSAWVRINTGVTNSGYVICKRDATSASWGLFAAENLGVVDRFALIGGSTSDFRTGAVITPATWIHVAATINGTAGEIFTNGASAATGTVAAIASNSSVPILIGARGNTLPTVTSLLNGQLDDIRVYNRVLSAAEIRLLASRRGIAYEPEPRRYGKAAAAAAYKAYWARYNQLLGAGPR